MLGIGDTPYEQLPSDVKTALTEYFRVPDMHDYDTLIRACGFYTYKYGKIDRFESLNEYWLSTEAKIRDDFNIPGIRGDRIDRVRRKSQMKQTFQAAGVPVAVGRVVDGLEDALSLIAETGYPVVAKPDAGVGALDTYRLDNDQDLNAFFERKPNVDYILEQFIPGTIYSFDGLTDGARKPVFLTAHLFSRGIMETVNQGTHLYYCSLRDIPAPLVNLGMRCLEAFAVEERFFHIEFFLTPKRTFVGLEVNMRPPGGFTTDMFNYACDIDIYSIWATLLLKGTVADFKYERKYHCCYASRKKAFNYQNDHDAIMTRFGEYNVQVVQVPGVFSSALGDIGYIFRASDKQQIADIIRYIHQPARS